MYLLILLFPLCGTILAGFLGHWIGGRGSAFIAIAGVFLAFIFSCAAFSEVALNQSPCIFRLGDWMTLNSYTLHWGFLFDSLTCVMLLVVTSISTLVHLYSTEYMGEDPHLSRFMSYLSFFTFFMLILVIAENFVQMFVGWEGVGLCSYLLINFWFARIQANKSAIKAMVLNRVGDLGLSLALYCIYYFFGSLDYSVVFSMAPMYADAVIPFFNFNINLLDFIGFFLFVGAVGKSAQVGLHTWLPDAMEGPTPVSALIHAATMVTAGVFLICRCSPLIQYAPNVSTIITVFGAMTAFLAAITGLLQNDLKRVIAYSTCSQLGYMVFAAGLSGYAVSVFHLSNHAFFKALLFLGAGSVIHAMADEQDMRKMGGLVKILPLTYSAMTIGSLALLGFPFLSGFYSKDIILELSYGSFLVEGRFAHTLGVVAAFFTAYYSTRLASLTFLRPANGFKVSYEHAHEPHLPMALPLMILSVASIFVGYLSRDMMIGAGTDFWGNALFVLPSHTYTLEAEWIDSSVKLVPLIFSFAGVGLAVYHYNFDFKFLYRLKMSSFGIALYTFFNRKWFFDKVYIEWVSQPLLNFAYVNAYQIMDRGLLEFFGPNGIFSSLYFIISKIVTVPIGFLFHLMFFMLLSIVFALFLVFSWSFVSTLFSGLVVLLAWGLCFYLDTFIGGFSL